LFSLYRHRTLSLSEASRHFRYSSSYRCRFNTAATYMGVRA